MCDGRKDGRTERWKDGQKKGHIEVGAPPKNYKKTALHGLALIVLGTNYLFSLKKILAKHSTICIQADILH